MSNNKLSNEEIELENLLLEAIKNFKEISEIFSK